ncbi:hypothetical protein ACHAXR_003975 [Thalassiosira sp. AJA248-18]
MVEGAADADTGSSNRGDDDRQPTAASNKRQLNSDHNKQQPSKRRKKNKKHKKAPQNKNNQAKHKKQNNWVENCSESIHRIPSFCVAPLTCVITRVEIEEEPLLPKGLAGGSEKDMSGEDCTASDGKVDNADVKTDAQVPSTKEEYQTAVASADDKITTPLELDRKISNVAGLSTAFLSQYAKKVSWKASSSVQKNDEEKKLFIPVKRHVSAIGPTKWAQQRKKKGKKQPNKSNYIHLTGGDNGDGICNPYPSSSVPDKFWAQRKRLFSRYDEGIQIGGKDDPEMWYSVTPESIANHVAERMVKMIRQSRLEHDNFSCGKSIVILDVFCGCGGNSIAFARLNNVEKKDTKQVPHVKVIAVDNSLSRLRMAANNASIYGIDKRDIVFIHADAIEVLNQYTKGYIERNADVKEKNDPGHEVCAGFALGGLGSLPDVDGIFLSPPWGGMDYGNEGGQAGFDPVSSITVESSLEQAHQDRLCHEENKVASVKTNGGELLSFATRAVFDNLKQEGAIAYFLPRNTNGVSMGQIAVASGIEGCFEMEQNVVNGKVKTVTAYFGHSVKSLLE